MWKATCCVSRRAGRIYLAMPPSIPMTAAVSASRWTTSMTRYVSACAITARVSPQRCCRRCSISFHRQIPLSIALRAGWASGPQSRPALRVLVVDDNIDAAESMAMLLEMEGHEVRIALDGEVALKAAEVFHPHVVVLDIGLPGMDGYEVARQLRSLHATNECLLIALTGYGQPEDAYRAMVAGFYHHLV